LRLRVEALTQEALAHASGLDRGYVGELERGRYNPTLETVYRLLPHLKVSFAEFAEEFDRTLKRVRRQAKP
jgi:transcriptional regulator with XRE-family HTH domain